MNNKSNNKWIKNESSLLWLPFWRLETCLHSRYQRLALLIIAIYSAAKSIQVLACLVQFIFWFFVALSSNTTRQFKQVLIDFDMLFQNLIYLPWLHFLMDGNRLSILLLLKASHISYFLLDLSYLYVSCQLFSYFLLETSEISNLNALLRL